MRLLLSTMACAALAACAHNIDAPGTASTEPAPATSAAPPPASAPTPTDAAGFVAMAGGSDMFEIQSSQIALQKTQNPQVRAFAQMLMQHHQMTTQQVMAAAQQAGLNPAPPALNAMQQQMIAELQATGASTFDAVYLRQQVPAHQMALQLHQNYAANGDTPALRTAAQGAVPIVTQHLEQAQTLMGAM